MTGSRLFYVISMLAVIVILGFSAAIVRNIYLNLSATNTFQKQETSAQSFSAELPRLQRVDKKELSAAPDGWVREMVPAFGLKFSHPKCRTDRECRDAKYDFPDLLNANGVVSFYIRRGKNSDPVMTVAYKFDTVKTAISQPYTGSYSLDDNQPCEWPEAEKAKCTVWTKYLGRGEPALKIYARTDYLSAAESNKNLVDEIIASIEFYEPDTRLRPGGTYLDDKLGLKINLKKNWYMFRKNYTSQQYEAGRSPFKTGSRPSTYADFKISLLNPVEGLEVRFGPTTYYDGGGCLYYNPANPNEERAVEYPPFIICKEDIVNKKGNFYPFFLVETPSKVYARYLVDFVGYFDGDLKRRVGILQEQYKAITF